MLSISPAVAIRERLPIDYQDLSIEDNNLLLILDRQQYDLFFDIYEDVKRAAAGLGYSNLFVQLGNLHGSRKKYKLSLFTRSF